MSEADKVYLRRSVLVISTVLYGYKSWVPLYRHTHEVPAGLHHGDLQVILGLIRWEKTRNTQL